MKRLFATRNRTVAQLARSLAQVAATELPVLLEGETGTGKSWVAQRIHRASRPGLPFVVVDCGSIPEGLFPAEVFGHVAGAFTDARRARVGVLARAAGGTVVLDRLDVLPGGAQVSLLRALDERRFTPLGGAVPVALRARIVALVGAGVTAAVADGRLRADLFHRVAGFHATLPPLRERVEDILPFARAFLRREGRRSGRLFSLTQEAETALLAHPWPGNFRELATVLTRACLDCPSGTITAALLGLRTDWDGYASRAAAPRLTLREMMRRYALQVLAQEGGNVSRAARSLGISRRTLLRWREGR